MQAKARLFDNCHRSGALYSSIAGLEKVGGSTQTVCIIRSSSYNCMRGISFYICVYLQAPLSRMEPEDSVNDRYTKIEERLAVSAMRFQLEIADFSTKLMVL